MSKCIKCRPLGPAARLQGYYETNATPIVVPTGAFYEPTGDFLSLDLKPFIIAGGLYLAYLILKKKHA